MDFSLKLRFCHFCGCWIVLAKHVLQRYAETHLILLHGEFLIHRVCDLGAVHTILQWLETEEKSKCVCGFVCLCVVCWCV